MIVPLHGTTVNQFDAGSKAVGYKKSVRQIAYWGNEAAHT
jgi:hypothetical protein